MPQVQPNTDNIIDFGFDVEVDIYARTIKFSTATLTNFNLSGADNVLGIAFHVEDSQGLQLMTVDWDDPHIEPAEDEDEYILDLSSSPLNFLFQNYKITGYIKDEDGTIYQTAEIYKNICQPLGVTESGYVPGEFEVKADCINNVLMVKEYTPFVYNNKSPDVVTKVGTLSYPSGTIAAVAFTSTPFSNNIVYTGQYRINNTTEAKYDMGDNVYVIVSYITNQPFPVTCGNFIGDITCCLTEVYNIYQKNCENATGQAALVKYNSVTPLVLNGLIKQINGQDASKEVAEIKKILNCDCGKTSLRQNEQEPTNPSVYSIVLVGVGGTTIGDPVITGNTKTFSVVSNSYVVAKGDIGDLAFTITPQTAGNVVTYKITFNYGIMAGSILTAIAADPTLVNQLNALITASSSILGLDGRCVIDLTKATYAVSQTVTGSTLLANLVINGTPYTAPGSLFANNATAVSNWLNSLALGNFNAIVASGILTIISVDNTNTVSTISFTTPNVTKQFTSTNATLVQVLQALVDYMCDLTAFQMQLGYALTLCSFDYNGYVTQTSYGVEHKQSDFNSGVASSICLIVNRINTLTGITCDKIKALFIDRPDGSFAASDRLYGTLGGDCAGLTDLQIGTLVIAAIEKYAALKEAWNAIDFNATSSSCPEISDINVSINSGNIAIYGVTFATATLSSKYITIKYRVNGTLAWSVAASNLLVFSNGNVAINSPFLISAGIAPGETYDIQAINNCGGVGFVKQITTPTSSVYEDDYLVDSSIYTICGETPVTLYSSVPFGPGAIMYSDIGLTTPLTGYTYITKPGSSIHAINTSTGVVGIDTGSSCNNGISGTYILGNDTGTICGLGPVTLYTDGAFAIGKILYVDESLVTPQTAFSYVVHDNQIYNKSNVTGEVLSSTGLACSGSLGTLVSSNCGFGNSISQIRFNGNVVGVSGGYPVNEGSTRSMTISAPALGGTLAIDITGHTGGTNSRIEIYDSNNNFSCTPIGANGTYNFANVDIIEGDAFTITIMCAGNCP